MASTPTAARRVSWTLRRRESFGQFTFEQQGQILRHYWELTQSGDDTSAYQPYVDSVKHGTSDGVYPEPPPPPGQPV